MEPTRDNYDEAAFAHYDAVIDALVARGIKPMITVHHFSNPIWVDDPRVAECPPSGPTDEHLCGFGHPTGGPAIVAEMAEFAGELARRYGDRVDEWVTVNEPINYLVASYMLTVFPPGRNLLFNNFEENFDDVVEDFMDAHVAMYDAIHENDTVDADDDEQTRRGGLHAQRHRVGTRGAQPGVGLRQRSARARHGALRLQPPISAIDPGGRDGSQLRRNARRAPRRVGRQGGLHGRAVLLAPGRHRLARLDPRAGRDPLLRGLRLRRVRRPRLRRDALCSRHGLRVLRARHLQPAHGVRRDLPGPAADRDRERARHQRGPPPLRAHRALARADRAGAP
jgi:hypothetical protein